MLVGKKAPNFISNAISPDGKIIEKYNFKENNKNYNKVLFFWPLNFTFVCPSEILAFNKRLNEFKIRNTIIIGVSIDSIYSHITWRNTPIEKGGIGKIKFTMISDINKEIQELYNVKHVNTGLSLRATFIIDKNNIIRHQSINDFFIGRNIKEILRIIDVINFHEKNGLVCPAQWKKGKKAIEPNIEGIKKYLQKNIKDL